LGCTWALVCIYDWRNFCRFVFNRHHVLDPKDKEAEPLDFRGF
jgi:hypothetical protein